MNFDLDRARIATFSSSKNCSKINIPASTLTYDVIGIVEVIFSLLLNWLFPLLIGSAGLIWNGLSRVTCVCLCFSFIYARRHSISHSGARAFDFSFTSSHSLPVFGHCCHFSLPSNQFNFNDTFFYHVHSCERERERVVNNDLLYRNSDARIISSSNAR